MSYDVNLNTIFVIKNCLSGGIKIYPTYAYEK